MEDYTLPPTDEWSARMVRPLRDTLEMTREEFGKAVGSTERTVYRWETGESEMRGMSAAVVRGLAVERLTTAELRRAFADRVTGVGS